MDLQMSIYTTSRRCEENLCVTDDPDCSTEADCEALGGEWNNCTNANRVTGDTDQEAAATLICK